MQKKNSKKEKKQGKAPKQGESKALPAAKTGAKGKPLLHAVASNSTAQSVNGKVVDGKAIGDRKTASEMQVQATNSAASLLSRVQMIAQYLKDLSFESPNAPQIFAPQQGQAPDFSIDINVLPRKIAAERYEVTLTLKVAMVRGKKTCFLVEIVYAGLVAVAEKNTDEALLQALLLIEVPRLLFPYARNILSELTQSSGFPPLVVQPVDFAALYRKRLAQAREQAQSAKSESEKE